MNGHGEKLSRKQQQAIAALLTCDTLVAAAQATGISVATLSRWLKRDDFAEAYRVARNQVVQQTINRLSYTAEEATRTLCALCADPDTPPSVRAAAAKSIIQQTLKAYELEDVSVRIAGVEKMMKRAVEIRANPH